MTPNQKPRPLRRGLGLAVGALTVCALTFTTPAFGSPGSAEIDDTAGLDSSLQLADDAEGANELQEQLLEATPEGELRQNALHIDTDDGSALSQDAVAQVEEVVNDLQENQADDSAAEVDGLALDFAAAGSVYTYPNIDLRVTLYTEIPESVRPELLEVAESAFTEWRAAVDLDLPSGQWHELELGWADFDDSSVLAGAASRSAYYDVGGVTLDVPLPLLETLGLENDSGFSFLLVFSSTKNWDFSTNPTENAWGTQPSIKSTMLHELGHGLGISSGMVNSSGFDDTQVPSVWDNVLYLDQDTSRPYRTQPNPTSNNLWFRNADGSWEKVYSPTSYLRGSSNSHLDESAYGRGEYGALMSPGIMDGEVVSIDGLTSGLLYQIGYEVKDGPSAPSISVSYNGSTTVSINPSSSNSVTPAATWTTQIRQGSTIIETHTSLASSRQAHFASSLPVGTYNARVIATTSGMTATSNTVTFTVTASSYLSGLNASESQIYRLYLAHLERGPEASGMEFWAAARAEGAGLSAVADFFAGSDEFVAKYGNLSNSQFVNLVYENVLDRPPDAGGLAFWVGRLSRGWSRGSVMIGFSESDEYVAKTGTASPESAERQQVQRLYIAFFGRSGDAAGLDHWEAELVRGAPLSDVSNAFVGSSEFIETYGSLSNGAFVDLVYYNVLSRAAEANGYSYWLGRLNSGMTRGHLVESFAESVEFRTNTRTY